MSVAALQAFYARCAAMQTLIDLLNLEPGTEQPLSTPRTFGLCFRAGARGAAAGREVTYRLAGGVPDRRFWEPGLKVERLRLELEIWDADKSKSRYWIPRVGAAIEAALLPELGAAPLDCGPDTRCYRVETCLPLRTFPATDRDTEFGTMAFWLEIGRR